MNEQEPLIPDIDRQIPLEIRTATFSMGCFWGPEALFGCMPEVIRTRVGYAGGSTNNPSYHHLDNHIETIQIDLRSYDRIEIS